MSKTQSQNKANRNSSCQIQAIQSSYPSQLYCALNLTPARRNSPASIKPNKTIHTQNLTKENCSKISAGPSNISTYLQCDEAFERRALGQPSNSNQDTVAQYLKEWEEQWMVMTTKEAKYTLWDKLLLLLGIGCAIPCSTRRIRKSPCIKG
jgi:hypothetical protein